MLMMDAKQKSQSASIELVSYYSINWYLIDDSNHAAQQSGHNDLKCKPLD